MVLSSFNANYMILLVCALANLTSASQEKQICDIGLIISDVSGSSLVDGEGNSNIHTRSLSSWTWILNHSPHRIPNVIFEAQCNSEYCVLPSGMDEGLNSVPIYQDILVLKLMEQKRCYNATFERVIVGCTCVRAKSS